MGLLLPRFPKKNSLLCPQQAGLTISEPLKDVFNGQKVEVWPCVTWSPKWALIFKDVKEKVNNKCSITQRSSLVVNGQKVSLDGLNLDGTLIINATDSAEVKLSGVILNKGWSLKHVDYKDNSVPEKIRIRGFKIEKVEQLQIN